MNIMHRTLLICFALLGTTGVALAQATTTDIVEQTATTSTTSEVASSTATASTTTQRSPFRPVPTDESPEPVIEPETTLSAAAQQRITNLAANLSNRFDAVIDRLEHILNRLESRTTKIEATGRDVSAARASLSTARTLLNQARTEMTTIDVEVAMVVGATNPRQEWQNLKGTYLTVQDLIQQSFTEMRNAISALKNSPSATPETSEATSTEPAI